jgi:hypothetical protein
MFTAMRLWSLRLDQRIGALSPLGKTAVVAALIVLLFLAGFFGLLPSKHLRYNPHAIFNW